MVVGVKEGILLSADGIADGTGVRVGSTDGA